MKKNCFKSKKSSEKNLIFLILRDILPKTIAMESSKKVVRNIPIWIEGRDQPILNKLPEDEIDGSSQGFDRNFHQNSPFSNDEINARARTFNDLKAPTTNEHPVNITPSASPSCSSSEVPRNVAQQQQQPSEVERNVPIQTEISQEQKHLESSIEKVREMKILLSNYH